MKTRELRPTPSLPSTLFSHDYFAGVLFGERSAKVDGVVVQRKVDKSAGVAHQDHGGKYQLFLSVLIWVSFFRGPERNECCPFGVLENQLKKGSLKTADALICDQCKPSKIRARP